MDPTRTIDELAALGWAFTFKRGKRGSTRVRAVLREGNGERTEVELSGFRNDGEARVEIASVVSLMQAAIEVEGDDGVRIP